MTSEVGSPCTGSRADQGLYDEKCDVWAWVCVCLTYGHPPFGWKEMASTQRKHGKESKDRWNSHRQAYESYCLRRVLLVVHTG